jgi:hypothetical protein
VTTTLSPGREARRHLAIWAAIDAHESGDADLLRRRLEELVELNERLRLEQIAECEQLRAELGYMPETVEGCIAVLAVAAHIVEVIGGDDGLA